MNDSTKKVPKLRFSGFSDEWEEKTISNTFNTVTDFVAAGSFASLRENVKYNSTPDYAQLVRTVDLKNNFSSKSPVYVNEKAFKYLYRVNLNKQTIALPNIGANIGESYFIEPDNLPYQNNVLGPNAILLISDVNDIFFLYCAVNRNRFIQNIYEISGASGQPKFNKTDLKKIKLRVPTKTEQVKIAGFLTAVDEKIDLLKNKKELLEKYKKGVMQQIFSQKIRFKDKNGQNYPTWQTKKLGDVFDRIKRKNIDNNSNVLTISAQMGLVNQTDFFNKSVSAKDLRGYYLLEKGDFAYNKSYSKGYPMGAIKRLRLYGKGVVSTLYICFKTKPSGSEMFFEQYFNNGKQNKEIEKIAQEGARNHGLLNISVVDFFESIMLSVPSSEEQRKIADYLSKIDEKIEAEERKLEKAKLFKKALLQQMFV